MSTPGRTAAARSTAPSPSALHDHAVDDALADYVRGRRVVGVMGGHAAERGTDGYRKAARLGRLLGRDATVATGGGPGAMEAANLGAWLADHPDGDLDSAITDLAAVPSFAPDVTAWARAAMAARARFGRGRDSLGVPTWFYGHEPPNVFADARREVLPQRDPRGRAAADLPLGGGLPAGGRRYRAGGVPVGLRELLRRPGRRRADGARRASALDRAAGLAAAATARPGPGDGHHVHLVDDIDDVPALLEDRATT